MNNGVDVDSRDGRRLGSFVLGLGPAPDWEAVVTFEVSAAGSAPTAFEIRSTVGAPVTRAVWDRVRVAALIEEARELTQWLSPATGQDPVPAVRRTGRRGRPPAYPDEFYRRVAAVYETAALQGKQPLRAVKEAFEGEQDPTGPKKVFSGLSLTTDKRARAWVRAARLRGYVSKEEMPVES